MSDIAGTNGASTSGKSEASQPQLPLFYKTLVPLDSTKHAKLRRKANANYAFARGSNLAPLLAVEFSVAQKHYPIVFARTAPYLPMALLGYEQGKNVFVDAEGKWQQGKYIPAYMRRFPFSLVPTTQDTSQLALCVDETNEVLEEGSDSVLFDGRDLSESGKKIMTFCQEFHRHLIATQDLGKLLNDLGLLQESSLRIQTGGRTSELKGFMIISEQKLGQLSDDDMLKLRPRGQLGVIYAHLMSLGSGQSVALQNRGLPEIG